MGPEGRPESGGAELISAARVGGASVFNSAGDRLGHVEDVMLHKASGKVAYAVISCGELGGRGRKRLPVAWSLLRYDTKKRGYVLPIGRGELESRSGADEMRAAGDEVEWRDRSHYTAAAYWL
jgi:sporulation protein YlmC with PRC-barrel domain